MSAKYFRDASNNYLGATSGEAMAGGIEVASAPSDARMVLANGAWVLPAGVSPAIDGSAATCKAWVNFKGKNTVVIRSSFNVVSVTDSGTGLYTIAIDNNMADTNYAVFASALGSSTMIVGGIDGPSATGADVKTVSQIRVRFRTTSGTGSDPVECSVAIFGN
jgi:hypothetical protein|tara:strand:+ start:320 stop:808 length:489 start_codon:yes stop_codon:yes gene_type:complete